MKITNHFRQRLKERFDLKFRRFVKLCKEPSIKTNFTIYKYGQSRIEFDYPHLSQKIKEEGDKVLVIKPLNMVIIWKESKWVTCFPIKGEKSPTNHILLDCW